MMQKTIFTDKTGKKSSKRILGFAGFCIGLTMFVVSGFHFYDVDVNGVLGLLGICGGMLSIGGLTKEG